MNADRYCKDASVIRRIYCHMKEAVFEKNTKKISPTAHNFKDYSHHDISGGS